MDLHGHVQVLLLAIVNSLVVLLLRVTDYNQALGNLLSLLLGVFPDAALVVEV